MLNAEPTGYAPHASGLLVPTEISRQREVWTQGDSKAVTRALKLLQDREIAVFLACPYQECRDKPLERVRNADGTLTLRCAHKDRHMTKL